MKKKVICRFNLIQVTSIFEISTLEKYELWFLFILSKHEIRISKFSFYTQIRDTNLKFLFLLSKFEIRISNFSLYTQWDTNRKFIFLLSKFK